MLVSAIISPRKEVPWMTSLFPPLSLRFYFPPAPSVLCQPAHSACCWWRLSLQCSCKRSGSLAEGKRLCMMMLPLLLNRAHVTPRFVCLTASGNLQSNWKTLRIDPELYWVSEHFEPQSLLSVVFNLFCSRTARYNFFSTLYPQSCWCIIQVMHSL
jgi:hypothetical protein